MFYIYMIIILVINEDDKIQKLVEADKRKYSAKKHFI